jgi:hypothetical protein
MSEEPRSTDPMVAALLREREGLVQRGLDDRVAQVDEQLALRGYTPPGAEKKTPTAGRSTAPRARRASRTETT